MIALWALLLADLLTPWAGCWNASTVVAAVRAREPAALVIPKVFAPCDPTLDDVMDGEPGWTVTVTLDEEPIAQPTP